MHFTDEQNETSVLAVSMEESLIDSTKGLLLFGLTSGFWEVFEMWILNIIENLGDLKGN